MQRCIRQLIVSQCLFYLQTYLDFVNKTNNFDETISVLKVGVIGAGVIGRLLLNSLISLCGWLLPTNIHVSSRRIEQLTKYEEIGVNVYFDNDKLVETCDVIFFCFPTSLDNWPILELKKAFISRVKDTRK